MAILEADGQIICDGMREGRKCRRQFNIIRPSAAAIVRSSLDYWRNVLQQALDCNWTYNRVSRKIFCPKCSQIRQP